MADMPRDRIFIGVRGCVVALEGTTGREVWRTKLRGQGFVTAGLLGGRLLAATSGRLFSLDPVTGAVLWENQLKGLGFGLISVAGVGANGALDAAAASIENQRRAAAAGAI